MPDSVRDEIEEHGATFDLLASPSAPIVSVIRDVALPTGLVDVKVCAADPIWSGLELMIRRELH